MKKDSKNQKIILGLIIVILIASVAIIIALIGILTKSEAEEDDLNIIESQGENFLSTYGKTESGGIDRGTYFDLLPCVRQYLSNINIKSSAYYTYDENGEYVLAVDEDRIKQKIYDLLSQSYIERNNVTLQNLYEKVETLETSVLFVPLEISRVQDEDIKSFIFYGLLESPEDYHVIESIYIMVNVDIANSVYSIEPISGEYNSIQEIQIDELETQIESNDNNKFSASYSTNEESAKDYINLYKRLALGAPETMYELLDEEYRIAKFGSLENFKQYVEENREQIIGINVEKYQVTYGDNYTQFVGIDQNGHYYIIREVEALDYTVILDTYTIDLPEFIEQYEEASNEQKVQMNIQRFFDAINDGDYEYAYSKLDETYKASNFATQTEFESYVKTNFFSQNSLASGSAEQQGDVYLYNVTISDATEEEERTVTTSFVMQLKEGTDFVMSFGV